MAARKAKAKPKEAAPPKPAAEKPKAKAKPRAAKATASPLDDERLQGLEAALAGARARLEELEQQQEATLLRTQELAEKAAARAEETEQVKAEAEALRAELAARPEGGAAELGVLRGQLAEANQRLVASTQLEWKLEVAQARIEDLEAELQQGQIELRETRERADELAGALSTFQRRLHQSQERETGRSTELERESARTAELDAQLRRFEAESRTAEERTRELERRLPVLETDLRTARSRSQELELQLNSSRHYAQELEEELSSVRTRSQELETEVQSLRGRPNNLLARVQGRESARSDEQQAQVTRAEARVRELQAQLEATSARCRELEARVESAPSVAALQEELMQAHGRASVLEGLLTEATTQIEKAVAPELERQLRHALARAEDLEQKLANSQPSTALAQMVKLGELETQLQQTRAELDRALEVEAAATARMHELEAVLANANIPRVAAQPVHHQAEDVPMPGLLYEPIFELVSGKLAGVEATPCWDDPEHGLIRVPGDSLPVTTCYQMLIEVCQLAAAWRAEGFSFFTALDTGSALLHHPELPGILHEAMRLGQLPADMVMLDIPGLASSEDGRLEAVLAQLSKNGIGLAVEGLGVGTASFAHLSLANLAKLDSRLVAALPQHPWAVQSAKAVLGMARGQGIRSAAVGVENEAQFRWLRNAQCELGQGSHLSPPVLPEQILDFARWGRLYA